jgi:hypothetical protein
MKLNWYHFKEWVEIAKNIVEIIAILSAGIWAYYTFVLKDAPGLEKRVKTESELIWNDVRGTETCEAENKVAFENIGSVAFDISKVRVRGWIFSTITLEDKEIAKYLDVNAILAKETPFFERTFENKEGAFPMGWAPFLGHYPPGATWKHSFQFVMKPVLNNWVLFLVEIYEKGNDEEPLDATYQWELICG